MTGRFADDTRPGVVARCHICRQAIDARGRCACAEPVRAVSPENGRGARPAMSVAEHNAFPKGRWSALTRSEQR